MVERTVSHGGSLRPDHFADMRESMAPEPAPLDPTLEYERYRITPKLLEKMLDLVGSPPVRTAPRAVGINDLLQHHTLNTFRDGQLDMVRMLESLMATQENQA